jgi:hypothetical protein
MRWPCRLKSPSLIAESVEDSSLPSAEHHTLHLGPDPQGRQAWVQIEVADGWLIVTALAEGAPDPGVRPDHPEWQNRAYLSVRLNPGHDHALRWLYAVDDRGEVTGEAHWTTQGEELTDVGANELKAPPAADGEFRYREDATFLARLKIPADSLWAQSGEPLGFSVSTGFHEAHLVRSLAWPEPVDWTDTPLVYGDLYKSAPCVRVTEIDFRKPVWGVSPITFSGLAVDQVNGQLEIEADLPGDGKYPQAPVPLSIAPGEFSLEIPLVFSFRAKWANGSRNMAMLRLRLVDASGNLLWAAEYPFGFDHGIIVREQFGANGGTRAERPDPSAPDFLDKFRAFILSGLPDYRLRTTRERTISISRRRTRCGVWQRCFPDDFRIGRMRSARLQCGFTILRLRHTRPRGHGYLMCHRLRRFPDLPGAFAEIPPVWVPHSPSRSVSVWMFPSRDCQWGCAVICAVWWRRRSVGW